MYSCIAPFFIIFAPFFFFVSVKGGGAFFVVFSSQTLFYIFLRALLDSYLHLTHHAFLCLLFFLNFVFRVSASPILSGRIRSLAAAVLFVV